MNRKKKGSRRVLSEARGRKLRGVKAEAQTRESRCRGVRFRQPAATHVFSEFFAALSGPREREGVQEGARGQVRQRREEWR